MQDKNKPNLRTMEQADSFSKRRGQHKNEARNSNKRAGVILGVRGPTSTWKRVKKWTGPTNRGGTKTCD